MKLASLGSGSRGNGTLVESGDTCLLVDCGFSLTSTLERLKRLGRDPRDLTAVLVTHEHGDHIRGVGALARRYRLPVYMTAGTALGYGRDDIPVAGVLRADEPRPLGGVTVMPVAVPHDTREPCQFVLDDGAVAWGVLTDLGSVTPHVLAHYRHCDGLLVEFNHDEELLRDGPYPATVKRRVAGDWGHLSNAQSAALLSALDAARLQHVVVGHLSEKNNTPAHAEQALAETGVSRERVTWATQDDGFDWLSLVT